MGYQKVWEFVRDHVTITVPGVVLVFAGTFCLVLAMESGEAGAAWVQAIGSVLALAGAAWLPIIHNRQAAKDRVQNTLQQIRMIAEDSYENMWLLTNLFYDPEKEAQLMQGYLRAGRDRDWSPIKTALSLLSTTDISAQHVRHLALIRGAVEYAEFVAQQLPAWILEGSSNPEVLVTLRAKRTLLALVKQDLPWPADVREGDKYAQISGQHQELTSGQPGPLDIDGVKVYLFYVRGEGQAGPAGVHFQVVFPFGSDHPKRHTIWCWDEHRGWSTYAEALEVVRQYAISYIHYVVNDWDWG